MYVYIYVCVRSSPPYKNSRIRLYSVVQFQTRLSHSSLPLPFLFSSGDDDGDGVQDLVALVHIYIAKGITCLLFVATTWMDAFLPLSLSLCSCSSPWPLEEEGC